MLRQVASVANTQNVQLRSQPQARPGADVETSPADLGGPPSSDESTIAFMLGYGLKEAGYKDSDFANSTISTPQAADKELVDRGAQLFRGQTSARVGSEPQTDDPLDLPEPNSAASAKAALPPGVSSPAAGRGPVAASSPTDVFRTFMAKLGGSFQLNLLKAFGISPNKATPPSAKERATVFGLSYLLGQIEEETIKSKLSFAQCFPQKTPEMVSSLVDQEVEKTLKTTDSTGVPAEGKVLADQAIKQMAQDIKNRVAAMASWDKKPGATDLPPVAATRSSAPIAQENDPIHVGPSNDVVDTDETEDEDEDEDESPVRAASSSPVRAAPVVAATQPASTTANPDITR